MPRVDWQALVDRRIPQIAGVYLASGWGLLEFSSWAAERDLIPGGVVDSLLAAWIFFFVPTLFLAWRAGSLRAAPDPPLARSAPSKHAASAPASVAVLPFENHSASGGDAYLSDGLTDEITTALAGVEGLRVASRTSTRALAREGGDVRRLGQALNVGSVLEGEVQRAGDKLRVSTRLVDVADGYQLWAGRYDGAMAEVFAIQDAISGNVVAALEGLVQRGSGEGLRAAARTDVPAYEFYLKGLQFLHQTRRKSLHYARTMFRRALEIDPAYAPAHAALAESIALERTYYPGAEAAAEEADRASRQALTLAPDLPRAHSARGFVLFTDGRLEEAEAEFRRAIELDPQLYEARYFFARMLFQEGRFEEAAGEFDAALAVRDDHVPAFFGAQAYEALGWEERALDRYRAAAERVTEHMMLNPDDARAATIRAVALCRTGRREEGLEWGRRAVEIDPEDAGVRYNLACLYAVAGEVEHSLDTLEAALRVGFGNREWLERDPDLATIRGHPRFHALVDPS